MRQTIPSTVGRIGRRALLACAIAGSIGVSMPGHAADPATVSAQTSFDIPAQPASEALNAFSRQSGLRILFPFDAVAGKHTRAIQGAMSNEAALQRLLADCGLVVISRQDGVITLGVPEAGSGASGNAVSSLDNVVVVGSRLGSAQAVPVRVVDRDTIDRSGAGSIQQVLNDLPEVSMRSTTDAAQNSRGNSTVSLRGLPGGMTLLLLNGRPLAPSAFQSISGVTNINLLPLAAVERIEVLPGGSSAIYGGDALAGVVNVVLKKDFDGAELSARYGSADGFGDRQFSLGWGKVFSRGSFSLLAQYDVNSELQASERTITASSDYSGLGGPVTLLTHTHPGNVYSLDGANLPGTTASFAAIPEGTDGVGLSPSDFAAGQRNTTDRWGSYRPLRPPTEQYGLIGYGTYALTPAVELYGELLYSHRLAKERDYPYYFPEQYGLLVPASNPFNPFGVDVGTGYVFDGAGRSCFCVTQEYERAVLGARGDVGAWRWDIGASFMRGRDESEQEEIDAAALNAAMADSDPATAFNPFADRTWTRDAIAPYVSSLAQRSETGLASLNGSLSGPLFTLPAGDVEVVIGAEYQKSDVDFNYYLTAFETGREVASAFSEVRVPVIGAPEDGGGERLVLSGAARFDHYSDFGDRLSPQVGLEVRPISSLLFRAAYSSAFKPPTLYQLHAPLNAYPAIINDPKRGESYNYTLYQGGNRQLDPMTGDTVSFGAVFVPASIPGFEASVSRWRTKIEEYASFVPFQVMADNEALFPGYIDRAEATPEDIAQGRPGRITAIRNVTLNYGAFDIAGIDLSLRWRKRTGHGELVPALVVTHVDKYDAALLPAAPVEDRAGKAVRGGYAPEWKGNASLAWNTGLFRATLVGNYVGSYEDYAPSTRRLGNFWLWDASIRYDLGKAFGSFGNRTKGAHVQVGARNLFDELPEFSYYNGGQVGYDPSQYDILGRYLYAELGLTF